MVKKPRYLELADDLRVGVLSGDIPPDNFPTEGILCKRYGVSRFTVREALRTLQAEGLIARKRGSGTVIQPAAARGGALHQPLSNVGEILQYARDTRYQFERLGETGLPKILAEQLGLVAGGRWSHFSGVRTRADSSDPIAHTNAYVAESMRAAAAKIEISGETIFRQLERLSGVKIVNVTQDIQAVAASAQIAKALNVPKRSPCLRILRCYFDGDCKVVEISASHHPGDRFAYAMHIEVDS